MIQYYKASLAIEAQALIAHGIISRSAYDKLVERQDLRIVRRGCRNTCALVDYESMPDRIKQAVVAAFGNPYDYVADNALLHHLQPSPAAAEWLEAYRPDGVRHLRTQAVCRYHAEACILDAIGRLLASRRSRSSALGHRSARLWDELARLVTLVDTLRWPHSLPRNPRSLERKYKAYMQDGCAALVHKGYANNNAARITDDTDIRALLALVSDPRNLSDAAVVRLYNAARPDRPVTPHVVARFRTEHEQEIYARRHGATRFRANRLMTVRRSAPTAPLRLWTLDGWDAELLYQRTVTDKRGHTVTTYHNRVKLEVVLDTCTRYPVGFAIADTESPELVRAALRNAINHCATLFGRRYRPQQLQMDRAGYQTLLSTYRQTALRVTPAAVRNAKAKVIEPWFRHFNDTYCHLQTNWSGYGLTARADAQPNTEFINRHRHSFPDRDGVIEQLTRFIEMERARLHDEFISRWQNQSTDVELCPMTDEQYLTAFGIHSEHTYLMRNTGIRFTLPGTGGRVVEFDCFDHEFRRHAAERWTVVYDPDDTSHALAVNADGSLRFCLERKHVQPMALCERRPGDAEALQRVRDFNRAEEQRITDALAGIDTASPLTLHRAPDAPAISTDFETLTKLCIVDSDSQHKTRRDAARLQMQQADIATEERDVSELY